MSSAPTGCPLSAYGFRKAFTFSFRLLYTMTPSMARTRSTPLRAASPRSRRLPVPWLRAPEPAGPADSPGRRPFVRASRPAARPRRPGPDPAEGRRGRGAVEGGLREAPGAPAVPIRLDAARPVRGRVARPAREPAQRRDGRGCRRGVPECPDVVHQRRRGPRAESGGDPQRLGLHVEEDRGP